LGRARGGEKGLSGLLHMFGLLITKLLKTQQPLKLEKNKHIFGIKKIPQVSLKLKTIKFYL